MLQFTRLRLSGFKSFVDRTELEIAPGLNGIVGPNGCGKSNIVEALRWAMGESSAKKMRGGGMEDVIFAGTAKRSQRNIAEVSLLLDNSSRKAPAAYNGHDELEIIRRIERDHGSSYKINGKTVRARDVQMLFADTITGANSPALVSQGRVTQIINAKPLERRLILEESAGVSGLYARRHEAELRLKATENNLKRVEDILQNMEAQLNNLKKQARQATKYRNTSAQIRQLEVLIAYLEWKAMNERLLQYEEAFRKAEITVAERLLTVTQLNKTHNTQVEDILPLRNAEAEIAAKLQKHQIKLQKTEDEILHTQQICADLEEQIKQLHQDRQHEEQSVKDTGEALKKLETEYETLAEKQSDTQGLELKRHKKEKLEKEVADIENTYNAVMQNEAETKARIDSLKSQLEQNRERLEKAKQKKEHALAVLKTFQESKSEELEVDKLRAGIEALEHKKEHVQKNLEAESDKEKILEAEIESIRDRLKQSEQRLAENNAEINMLHSFLNQGESLDFTAIIDDVKAQEGFEKALSRALGDTLLASCDNNAPQRWLKQTIKDLPDLPQGVTALQTLVRAPGELHLALSQIGIAGNKDQGFSLQKNLKPGQTLVSKEGHLWRWDGLYIDDSANDPNAVRLQQKNKFDQLAQQKPKLEKSVQNIKNELAKKQQEKDSLDQAIQRKRQLIEQYQNELGILNQKYAEQREKIIRTESEEQRLNDNIKSADEDIATIRDLLKWDEQRLEKLKDLKNKQKTENIEDLKTRLQAIREDYQNALSAFEMHKQQINSRQARLHAISDERVSVKNRSIRAQERLKQIQERLKAAEVKLKDLTARPDTHNDEKQKLLQIISELEQARREASEKLSAKENELHETIRAQKDAEQNLSNSKEARARAGAGLETMNEQKEALEQRLYEDFEMKPTELQDHLAQDINDNTQNVEALKSQKERITKEREAIGAVNLRAEEELDILQKEVSTLLNERNDLMAANDELRKAIQKINKEARERLLAAFEHVNAHYKNLFMRLFNGGQAELVLIDSEDPLGAGLEIMAQPPGKKLQSLSLLSGGEQTLASIALIFAMFLTNPSPICVLDEIDAPLDDANVDRVCDLLEEIAERGLTRFLVITHHRMTMARMDRLYGVTMTEKGVSQLVSVDLQQSFDFLEAA